MSSSSLSKYAAFIPSPISALLKQYDIPCKNGWKSFRISLSVMLVLILTGIGLLIGGAILAPDETSSIHAVMLSGIVVFMCGLVVSIPVYIYAIRGNVCKAKKEIAFDLIAKNLDLVSPQNMLIGDQNRWAVIADQVDVQIRKRMTERYMKRAVVAAVMSRSVR